jgi:carboxylate-amine ligase
MLAGPIDRELKPRRRTRRSEKIPFRFGIEEEFFVCDAATLQPAMNTPESLFKQSESPGGGRLNREMLQAQLEVVTRPHVSAGDARHELLGLRRFAAESAKQHGFAVLAAGTHPTADWTESVQSSEPRYDELMQGLQMVGRRNVLCGMHVHVEVHDPDCRIDIMRRMIPFVPLLLALSTSSPFWRSRRTGLKGYRLTAYDELPRTGMPELFRSEREYEAYVSALVRSGAMPNATHVWWAIRPSHKYPTLELRATDCCTRLDDALAVAALYRCLVSYLSRKPHVHADFGPVERGIAVENKWRAQRYGVEASFASPDGAISISEMLDDILVKAREDAEILECWDEVHHCGEIISGGSSADRQLRVFEEAGQAHAPGRLDAVLRWIADATVPAHGEIATP